jgi:crossover junction endodeoxyribonuclease RusA
MKELVLPWPPKELSPNARMHWAAKSKVTKAYRHACWALTKESGLKVDWEGKIHVWADFYPPDRRHRDWDNIYASGKAAFDGLADGLGVNDKRFSLHPWVKDEIGGMIKIRLTPSPAK